MLYELSFLSKLYVLGVLFDLDADPSYTRRIEGGRAAPRGGGSGQEGEDPRGKACLEGLGRPWTGGRVSIAPGEACPVSAPLLWLSPPKPPLLLIEPK